MEHDPNLPAPNSHEPRRPRVFAIVYIGEGAYGLDVIEAPVGPRRLRQSNSLAAIRTQLAGMQQPGDIVLMSEVLRGLEMLSAPMQRIRLLESVLGPDLFEGLNMAEVVPEFAAQPDGEDASEVDASPSEGLGAPTISLRIDCGGLLPRHRIADLLDDPGSDDAHDEPHGGPQLN